MLFNNFCQNLKIKEEHKEDVKRYLTNFHGIITITTKRIGDTYRKNNISNIFKIGSEIKDGDDIFKLLEIIEINYNISAVSKDKTYLMKFHNKKRNELYLLFHWGSVVMLLNSNNIKNKFTDLNEEFIKSIVDLKNHYNKILLFGHSLGGVMCQFIIYNICKNVSDQLNKFFMITTGAFCWMNDEQYNTFITNFENQYINIALCSKYQRLIQNIDEKITFNLILKNIAINMFIYKDTAVDAVVHYFVSKSIIDFTNSMDNDNDNDEVDVIIHKYGNDSSLHLIKEYKKSIKYILTH